MLVRVQREKNLPLHGISVPDAGLEPPGTFRVLYRCLLFLNEVSINYTFKERFTESKK